MPGSSTGFQTFVNKELPNGLPGDFAGANIRANVIASPWGFKAPAGGTLVGVAAWANPTTGVASNYYQPSSFAGFVHREGQGLITQFLGIASVQILGGDMVTVMDQGDFWGLFAAGGTATQKVYADPVTGALTANATGQSVTATASAGSTIASNVLTTTDADVTGTIAVGQIVTGAGIPAGTYIASAAGTGSGTHLWNLANADGTTIPNISSGEAAAFWGVQETQFYLTQTVTADASFTATLAVPAAGTAYGVLTVSAVGSGTLVPGQFISSAGTVAVPTSANMQILQQLTGTTGSTGTYLTTNTYYAVGSGQTFTGTQGKVGKISSWANWT